MLRQLLEQVLLTAQHPRTLILVVVQVGGAVTGRGLQDWCKGLPIGVLAVAVQRQVGLKAWWSATGQQLMRAGVVHGLLGSRALIRLGNALLCAACLRLNWRTAEASYVAHSCMQLEIGELDHLQNAA
jgi:hypothetical protein